jgi:hypothetical protein
MNSVLKEDGFLDIEPGNNAVSEKGETFAIENHQRGTGGYSCYNRYWSTRNWDDEIKNEMILAVIEKVKFVRRFQKQNKN